MMQQEPQDKLAPWQQNEIYGHYRASEYLSIKVSSYFQVYEELLARYRNRRITFVEVGVFNGGSLFMWRSYFGPEARIIGIDLNPAAKKWEQEGFEIHIGSQSDPQFWERFFAAVGEVDVLLDDGGHTNEQQIITVEQCLPHIRDGGLLLVEDVHASYLPSFGNPSRYSFVNYAKRMVDSCINARFPGLRPSANPFRDVVYAISFYESMVCYRVDRTKCFTSQVVSNAGISSNAVDFVYDARLSQILSDGLTALFRPLGIKVSARRFFRAFENFAINRRIAKYFR